jgi:carboxyl-terminal processing protease
MNSNHPLKRALLYYLWAVLIVAAAFLSGYYLRVWMEQKQTQFPVLQQAYTLLKEHALNDLPSANAIEHGMIRGMLQAYNDPYTILVEPAAAELQTNQLEGKFGGIGVRLEADAEGNLILHPLPDSPAANAGVLESDRLIGVDDLNITPQTKLEEVQAAVRGETGTPVKITIARPPNYAPQTFIIKRAEVELPSVTWNLAADDSRVGVIQINIIAATTPDEITTAIKDLKSKGATHFVLDLRNNGGGLLNAGIDTARLFLKEGIVIQQQFRDKPVENFRVTQQGQFLEEPLAVLINQNTASASEIIAGALQKHGRAKLIGSPSFGKNTIQQVYDLADKSSLHITAARWWVPDLKLAEGNSSLLPDISVNEDTKNPDAVLQAAINLFFQ